MHNDVTVRIFLAAAIVVVSATGALAQFKEAPPSKGPQFEGESTTRIRIGVIVKASSMVHNVLATAPIPMDWPEQSVRVVGEDISPTVKSVDYRVVGNSLKQMVVQVPQLPAGQEARAVLTFEVTRRTSKPPADTSIYTIPKKLDRQLNVYVGTSPYIESRHPKVLAAAKEALGDEEPESDWKKVEMLYDWTRANIAYKGGELKGAARALYEREGGADELTSVFIAMCRAKKIPARTVFTFGNVHAEFYLEDDEGHGHWFPAQVAGVKSFGGDNDTRAILQKGDNFKNPDNPKERQRMVTEYFNAAGRGGKPGVQFISELVR